LRSKPTISPASVRLATTATDTLPPSTISTPPAPVTAHRPPLVSGSPGRLVATVKTPVERLVAPALGAASIGPCCLGPDDDPCSIRPFRIDREAERVPQCSLCWATTRSTIHP